MSDILQTIKSLETWARALQLAQARLERAATTAEREAARRDVVSAKHECSRLAKIIKERCDQNTRESGKEDT